MRIQSFRCSTGTLLSLVVLGWAAAASSGTISTSAEARWDAPFVSDRHEPVSTGTLVSSASGHGGQADAIGDASGSTAVRLGGAIANGQRGNILSAYTDWTETVTNGDVIPRVYQAELTIPEIQLFFSGSEFHALPEDRRSVAYVIHVFHGGGNPVFHSQAELFSGPSGHVLQELGTDLGGVKASSELRYTFAPSSRRLFVAVVEPGQSLDVGMGIQVYADMPGFEVSTDASIGDPFGLERVQITLSDVPEPAVGLAWPIAAACLLAIARRRRPPV